jgi:6-phosphofructokinase 1
MKYLKAGPRKYIYFKPDEVRAAIVTCGGLCPGLNVVIREIVMRLWFNYGVKSIYGVKWGYGGFWQDPKFWIDLNPDEVRDIHTKGGTILGSARGGFDLMKTVDELEDRGINQLYAIGGDGTHYVLNLIHEEISRRGLEIAICGIPKTIDNDIPIIDRSFGFETSCEQANRMIAAANVEAESAPNGVGLVKVMGRDSGFIAMNASMSSRDVNLCVIPEWNFEIEGKHGLCEYVVNRLKHRDHAVVVVAEGAAEGSLDTPMERGDEKDGGGHIKHADIGAYLAKRIPEYAKENHDMKVTLKYIDPTYAIRGVRANAADVILCTKLGQRAVDGVMAGYTGFSVGVVRDSSCFIPIQCINQTGKR